MAPNRFIAEGLAALGLALIWPAASLASPLSNVAAIAAGSNRTCALTLAGGVKCWGFNGFGPTNSPTYSPTPTDVAGLASGVSAIAVRGPACALTTAGGVKCWGTNYWGQLGNGTSTTQFTPPSDVSGLTSGVKAIATGNLHACALTTAGGVKCWGDNLYGQVGRGQYPTGIQTVPADVSGLSSGVAAIAAGSFHTCALLDTGALMCWGANFGGSLGDGTTTVRYTPVAVSGLGGAVQSIHLGNASSCAILAGGGAMCWGGNAYGELGDGTTTDRPLPTPVTVVADPIALIGGENYACALTSAGGVKCWGRNNYGQLGDGTTTDRTTASDVFGLDTGIMSISGTYQDTCAVTTGMNVKCWGENNSQQLGNSLANPIQPLPVMVGDFMMQTITFDALPNRNINDAAFSVTATASSGLPVYFSSLTTSVCTVSGNTVALVAIGICDIAANQPGDNDYGPAPQSVRTFLVSGVSANSPTRLANISTRGQVLTGYDIMIGGFVIGGTTSKTVVIRAIGPSLASSGVANPLPDPKLTIYSSATNNPITFNDDWQTLSYAATLQQIAFAPGDPHESAVLVTLQPGAYTAIVTDSGSGTGVALVEVYEINREDVPLINISTRGHVGTDFDVMIGGFVITGNSPQTVVVTAKGPTLANYDIPSPLANPTLTLVRQSDQSIVATNDDWGSASNASQIQSSGFAPSNSLESAILVTLPPGAYTAIVSGVGGGTGTGIVEVYATQ